MRLERHRLRAALAAALPAALPEWLAAKKGPKHQGPFELRTRSLLINLTIAARYNNGEPVADLQPGDIVVRKDGKTQTRHNFRRAVPPSAPASRPPASPRTPGSSTAQANLLSKETNYVAFVMDDASTSYLDLQQGLEAASKWVQEGTYYASYQPADKRLLSGFEVPGIGVNFIDVYFRKGLFKTPESPVRIGCEGDWHCGNEREGGP